MHPMMIGLFDAVHQSACADFCLVEVLVKNRLSPCAERGWSQADLAERLDVSRQSQVNAIEIGKYDPSLPLAFRIARLFEAHRGDFTDEA